MDISPSGGKVRNQRCESLGGPGTWTQREYTLVVMVSNVPHIYTCSVVATPGCVRNLARPKPSHRSDRSERIVNGPRATVNFVQVHPPLAQRRFVIDAMLQCLMGALRQEFHDDVGAARARIQRFERNSSTCTSAGNERRDKLTLQTLCSAIHCL